MFDETPEQPTDETPGEENVEPTSAPDEAPAEADDITQTPEETPPQPTQAEGDDDASAGEAEAEAEAPAADETPAEAPAADETPSEAPAAERPKRKPSDDKKGEPEVIPGAHLEPDLVLDQPSEGETDEYAQYAVDGEGDDATAEGEAPTEAEPAAAVRSPLELAADARYQATGKRKTAIARVILKPGSGTYVINGKDLETYFPRPRLQTQARQPLEATGNLARMDVVARIHGGGVSAQAGALRHGIARALVEAEPSLRSELKRRGYLTRDPREKERKKAGLKKARKRPQFSKR
jgi:small subunit ribosomal protein S9